MKKLVFLKPIAILMVKKLKATFVHAIVQKALRLMTQKLDAHVMQIINVQVPKIRLNAWSTTKVLLILVAFANALKVKH